MLQGREQEGTQSQLDAVTRRAQQLERDLQAAQAQEAELQRKLVDSGAEVTFAGWHAPLQLELRDACWQRKLADNGAGVRCVVLTCWQAGAVTGKRWAQEAGPGVPPLHGWQLRLIESVKVGQAG